MGWFSTAVGGRQALFHNGVLSTFYSDMTLFLDTGDGFVILANVNGLLPVRLAFPRYARGSRPCSLDNNCFLSSWAPEAWVLVCFWHG